MLEIQAGNRRPMDKADQPQVRLILHDRQSGQVELCEQFDGAVQPIAGHERDDIGTHQIVRQYERIEIR